jgi:hypothetical protein
MQFPLVDSLNLLASDLVHERGHESIHGALHAAALALSLPTPSC